MKFLKLVIASLVVIAANAKDCGSGIGKCKEGYCCSKYGYCGKSEAHCGSGCQSEFGICGLNNKKISTNGRCGSSYGACPNGQCCSKYGYCGTSEAHCGSGCQSEFGNCGLDKKDSIDNKKISTNGKCGSSYGVCPNSQCCSKYGYCGTSEAHCGTGCQSEFGNCKKVVTTTTTKKTSTTTKKTSTSSSKKTSTNGRCGGDYGMCPDGKCCSKYGYCGRSDEYCASGCQPEFGSCGTSYSPSSSSSSSSEKAKFQIYYECKNKNEWALTFDDGPYKYDMELLDLLAKYNIKATFFVNGDNVLDIYSSEGEKIIKRMHKEGHIIGNHTWKHMDLNEASKSEIIDQMTRVEDAIYKYIGKKPAFMRLPYGSGTGNSTVKETLNSLGYTAGFQWNVDTNDWKYAGDVDYALNAFKEKLGQPILSLNHVYYQDITKEKLLTLTEKEIKYMLDKGYTPVTADRCVGLSAYK